MVKMRSHSWTVGHIGKMTLPDVQHFTGTKWTQSFPVNYVCYFLAQTNLDLCVSTGGQRQESGSEQRLKLGGAAGGCDDMDHLHA